MVETRRKVAVIACSGEEIAAGTLTRQAVRRVLETLRPGRTVTICLPLFLAGSEEERAFARNHPTVAVDGCAKRCAQRGTETHSGPVGASLVVTDLLGEEMAARCSRSCRNPSDADREAVWVLAERIADAVDALLEGQPEEGSPPAGEEDGTCSCTRPLPGITLTINGKGIQINGLNLIFGQLAEEGVPGEERSADLVLNRVKIYHPVPPEEEREYRGALLCAYQEYRRIQ